MHTHHYTYTAIALAHTIQLAAHYIGIQSEALVTLTELVILGAYIKLARP